LYGNMSRFAKHMRVGTHVQQGDVIGYVGMTGLATGPHLHYEYLVNGVHKNPQTVHLAGAEPLQREALQRFRDSTAPLLAALLPAPSAPGAALGPLAVQTPGPAGIRPEPLASGSFSVSSVLEDSRSSFSDNRSRISTN